MPMWKIWRDLVDRWRMSSSSTTPLSLTSFSLRMQCRLWVGTKTPAILSLTESTLFWRKWIRRKMFVRSSEPSFQTIKLTRGRKHYIWRLLPTIVGTSLSASTVEPRLTNWRQQLHRSAVLMLETFSSQASHWPIISMRAVATSSSIVKFL